MTTPYAGTVFTEIDRRWPVHTSATHADPNAAASLWTMPDGHWGKFKVFISEQSGGTPTASIWNGATAVAANNLLNAYTMAAKEFNYTEEFTMVAGDQIWIQTGGGTAKTVTYSLHGWYKRQDTA